MNLVPEEYCIRHTNFIFKNQKSVYHGKVRDVYDMDSQLLVVCTDRISAFDHILPRPIPYKGQVLNQIAQHFLEASKEICPVWLQSVPDPNVSVGVKCNPIPIEVVVRGYLAGHAWRQYRNGERSICGVRMKNGMKESEEFDQPIITPTTKALEGHDMDISREEILNLQIVKKSILDEIYDYAFSLFELGSRMAYEKGLILVDTKYEFGLYNGQVMLMDEVHTPDSSRYYVLEGYRERLEQSKPQIQLSKEFVREWLMSFGFQGRDNDIMPQIPDTFVWEISKRYIELFEKLTGKEFVKFNLTPIEERIKDNLKLYF